MAEIQLPARASMLRPGLTVCLALTVVLPGQGALPDGVRRMLDSAYPSWHFAAPPSWITADLDGDRRPDYVVQVVSRGGQDSLQAVVAFLRRGDGYRQVPIDSFPSFGGIYLTRSPAGTRVADFDADPMGETLRALRHDGVTLVFGEQAATTCVYSKPGFRCWTSAD